MAKEQKKAKGTNETKPAKRKLDPEMEELRKPERGKKKHQQLKAYMVLECLMRETNEKKPLSARDIVAYLEDFGISAEATSVRNDIKEINYVMYMLEYGCTIDVAIEELDSGDYEEDKFIKYSQKQKGYYVSKYRNNVTEQDARVIAECIYSCLPVNKAQADRLVDIACSLVDTRTAARIKMDARDTVPKWSNKEVSAETFYNITTIMEAMGEGSVDEPRLPEKITFAYQELIIDNANSTVIKKTVSNKKVSPFKLYFNGEYYLDAFDDEEQKLTTFFVGDMKGVKLAGEPRDSEELYELCKKTQKPLFNNSPPLEPVEMLLIGLKKNLRIAYWHFGTGENIKYYDSIDDKLFFLQITDVPGPLFFALMLALTMKIVKPVSVARDFFWYLLDLQEMYLTGPGSAELIKVVNELDSRELNEKSEALKKRIVNAVQD